MTPFVVDLYGPNELDEKAGGFEAVKASGIQGIIHKATQGGAYVDKAYAARKVKAKAAGLLWGAYHFGTSANVEAQVDNYLKAVGDDPDTLLCLDFEENPTKDSMSIDQAKAWLELVYARTGVRPVIYSGNYLKERMRAGMVDFFSQHRLWLAQYGEHAHLPPGFKSFWLWQFTGDGSGPGPHSVPGIKTAGIDISTYQGADLAADWAHPRTVAAAPVGTLPVPTTQEPAPVVPDDIPAPAVVAKPSVVKTAAKSPTLVSLGMAKVLAILGIFTGVLGSGFDSLFSATDQVLNLIPGLVDDVTPALTAAESASKMFGIDWPKVSVSVSIALMAVAFVRRLNRR